MHKLWLYLHFPALQLDALQTPNLALPTIILDAQNNQILQLNHKAKEQGIQIGMGLGTASALCSELQVEPYNADIEVNQLMRIADSLYRLTSDIALMKPRGLLLRIHNMLRLYQGLDNYWQAIDITLREHNVHYQFATCNTSLGAKLLAQTGWNHISDNTQLQQTAIRQCDIKETELDKKTIQHLQRVGIRTVEDLAKLPLPELARRFDIQIVTYIGRLLGELQHNVPFYHPEKQFHRRIELLYDITDTEKLLVPLSHLLLALEQFLQLREQVAQALHITLMQREASNLLFTISAAEGLYRQQHWLPLLTLKLESVQLQSPVCGVALKAEQVHLRESDHQDLFQGKQSHFSFHQLLSLLQAKLGEHAVKGITLEDDYRIELSSAYVSPGTVNEPQLQAQANRPLFILPQPIKLTDKVRIVSGPERIEWGWWDKHPVHRDYFIARHSDGRWCWIYRTPEHCWYLQGYFS